MIEQTLAQDALPDHARRSEENHFHLTVSYFSRRRVPQRVRRPAATGKALGLIPLVKAGWAHASRVERVPFTAAGAEPFVFLARRPAAERAADARTGWLVGLIDCGFAVKHSGGGVVRHSRYYGTHERAN